MTTSPLDKIKSSRLLLAIALCSGLFFSSVAPNNAYAACCVTSVVSTPDADAAVVKLEASNTAQLGVLAGFQTTLNSIWTYIQSQLLPSGLSAVAAAVNVTNTTLNNTLAQHADYVANGRQYVMGQGLAAENNGRAVMPNQTSACAVSQAGQVLERMQDAAYAIGGSFTSLVEAANCAGPQSNCSGPGRQQEAFYDLCHLGFLSPTSYGQAITTLGCPAAPDSFYINGDENLGNFLHTLQMPLASACILPDNYPYFSTTLPPGVTACKAGTSASATYNADPTKSQLAWVAAFKYCENLEDDMPQTPVYTTGRTVTSVDIQAIMRDRRTSTRRMSVKNVCLKALWQRTACPSTGGAATNPTAGGADNCATYQKAVCDALATAPNGSGADPGGGSGNAPTYAATTGMGIQNSQPLNDCQAGAGLSPLMARKIMAYRCLDDGWMQRTLPSILGGGGTHEVERFAQTDCQKMQDRFEASLKEEEEVLSNLFMTARARRNEGRGDGTHEEPSTPGSGVRPQ